MTGIQPMSSVREDFAWFRAVDAPFGPTWWSSRHGRFVTVVTHDGPRRFWSTARGAPGVPMIAWADDHRWFVTEHVIGPTLAEVLATTPELLSTSARQAILGRVLGRTNRYVFDGWRVPKTSEVRLGFDGIVVVEAAVQRPLPSPGMPDTPGRDDYHDARDAADNAFEHQGYSLAHACGLSSSRWRSALDSWATMELPLATLLEHAPGREVWAELRERLRREAWEGAPPPDPYTEAPEVAPPPDPAVVAEEARQWTMRRRELFAQDEAELLLNDLAERDQDFVSDSIPDIDVARDAPDAVARLQLMRERPLSRWTWLEHAAWSGVRRQRLRALHDRHSLAPEQADIEGAERACEGLILSCGMTPEVSPPLLAVVDLRLRHLAAFDPRIGERPSGPERATIEAERGELIARGLFGIEGWCAAVFDGATPDDLRSDWRTRWLEVDAALGDDGVARAALLPPQFPPADAAAIERVAGCIGRESTVMPPVIEVEVDAGPHPHRLVQPGRWHVTFRKGEVVVGRSAACDLCLGHGISRRHLSLRAVDGVLTIADLGTANGVTIDGTSIREPVALEPGQVAHFGPYALRARLLPPDAPWLDDEPT